MTEKTTHSDYKVRLPWFGLPRLVPFLKPYKGIVICMAVLVLLNGVIHLITRRSIPSRYEGYVHAAGMVLLLGFMAVVMFNDISRLIT